MAASKKVAIVIIDSDWAEQPGVKRFLAQSHKPLQGPPSHAKYILAPIVDMSDPKGLWLGEVTTEAIRRRDGKPFDMKFMIPWRYVLGFGAVEESGKKPIGFLSDAETIVLGSPANE